MSRFLSSSESQIAFLLSSVRAATRGRLLIALNELAALSRDTQNFRLLRWTMLYKVLWLFSLLWLRDDSLAGCVPSSHSFFPFHRNQIIRMPGTTWRATYRPKKFAFVDFQFCSSASTNLPPLPKLSPLRSHSLMLV